MFDQEDFNRYYLALQKQKFIDTIANYVIILVTVILSVIIYNILTSYSDHFGLTKSNNNLEALVCSIVISIGIVFFCLISIPIIIAIKAAYTYLTN